MERPLPDLLIKTLGLTAEFDSSFDDAEPGAYYYEALGIARQLCDEQQIKEHISL